MTLPRLYEITAYQRDNPPLHLMVATYLGIGQQKKRPSELDEHGQSLFDLFPRT